MNLNRLLGIAGAAALVVSLVTLAWLVYLAPPQRGAPTVRASRVEPKVATMNELGSLEGRVIELEDATGVVDVEDIEARVTELEQSVGDTTSVDDLDARVSDLEFSVGAATGVDDLEARLSDLEGRVDALCIEASLGC